MFCCFHLIPYRKSAKDSVHFHNKYMYFSSFFYQYIELYFATSDGRSEDVLISTIGCTVIIGKCSGGGSSGIVCGEGVGV